MTWQSPLIERYSSRAMAEIFSPERKFRTWRRLWVELARVEQELGLSITDSQIKQLESKIDDLNLDVAAKYEKELRHDVMAHIRAYGDQCPEARGIIHWGATSMYVVDNTDVILVREAMELIRDELRSVAKALAGFAEKHKAQPTVAFTHFQPAQFTTVGRRGCLWLQDILLDLDDLDVRMKELRFLGCKGATGTQASFMELLNDEGKVNELDERIARAFGFEDSWPVTGQTYTRKIDARIAGLLGGIAQSAHKFSNDMRLLQHLGEIREPFGKKQVGSSAMAYKRNPMKAERIASLSRVILTYAQNAAFTAASQWFERTLDDSAGKRIVVPESFMATDAVLNLYLDIASGFDVNDPVIARNVERELPFIASEHIMMAAVEAGGDRQELHETIRKHSMAARESMEKGNENDLMDRLDKDEAFAAVRGRMSEFLQADKYVGLSPSQVDGFLRDVVSPRLGADRTPERKPEVRV